MKPERWQQINKLFQAALALDPADRDSFLDHACKDDHALRREVESLIASHDSAGSFIESPAVERAAPLFTDPKSNSVLDRQIGPYRVIGQLGVGGMGEVYLAQDARLGRKVALKLLPDYFTQDQQRVRRFQQEARAASALNHPNIITIHEIGEVESRHYIATEFVEGVTLRHRMSGRRMSIPESLDVGVQVTGALAAAHQAGIVHRDIKPENIMLRPDGIVKVLDFGLAKLAEQRGLSVGTEAPTVVNVNTDPGIVMGTVHYMSPEQARGQVVDARTDIFSLGVVIYEMVAGRVPFEGETASDVIAAILKSAPPPLSQYEAATPSELQRIVSKALRKDRDERYQTIKDMLVDLKSLRQEIEFEARQERSSLPEISSEVSAATLGKPGAIETANNPAVQTVAEAPTHTTSSAEYLIGEIKRHKRTALLVLGVILLAVLGIIYELARTAGNKTSSPSQSVKIAKLTNTGKALEAAISPDGKYVAYVESDGRKTSIWLRLIDIPTSSIQLVTYDSSPIYIQGTFSTIRDLAFSHDGKSIYYYRREQQNSWGAIYQVPMLGGTPKKLVEDVGGRYALSRDGKRFAFLRYFPDKMERALMVANADGTGEQVLASRSISDSLLPVAWSPDGSTIACIRGWPNFSSQKIVEVRVADGSEKPVSSQTWAISGGDWLPDGSGLIISGQTQLSDLPQIWHIAYPGGEARKITNDSDDYRGVSLTADLGALVTTQYQPDFNLWILPEGDSSRARPITSGKHNFLGLSWTPDGKIVYQAAGTDERGIYIMNSDGTGKKQLLDDALSHASISPDGRFVVFSSGRSGPDTLWRMDINGENQKQFPVRAAWPQCSPDGRWIIYTITDQPGENYFLGKIPIDGGEPKQITDKQAFAPVISPDGKFIACNHREQANSPWKIAVLPSDGGAPLKVFDISSNNIGRRIRWTPDGRALTYNENQEGVTNLWIQPVDGGPPKRLTNFTDGQIRSFAWSRDGKQLAISRGEYTNDVVLISNFR
jgi:eukaryotic-like serine/threonine-protein kinase